MTSDPARFWSRVKKNSGPSGKCWEWTGHRNHDGYGRAWWNGRHILAHRLAWLLNGHSVPNGLCLCHRCDNPPCVRPEHLFVATQKENIADSYAKGRQRTEWPLGEAASNAKITADDVRMMRSSGESPKVLAARYRLDHSNICKILRRTSWRHVE